MFLWYETRVTYCFHDMISQPPRGITLLTFSDEMDANHFLQNLAMGRPDLYDFLRQVLAQYHARGVPSQSSNHDMVAEMARAIVTGHIVVAGYEPKIRFLPTRTPVTSSNSSGNVAAQTEQTEAVIQHPPAASKEQTEAEVLLTQIATWKRAAVKGVPFCEVCS